MAITVSIVEDNDQLRGTLARVLGRAEGFQCLGQHATAEAALEALPKERPNVVLMDINLPGMSGVECVRQLKQLLPETQVMMLTAYEDTENIFNSLAASESSTRLTRRSIFFPDWKPRKAPAFCIATSSPPTVSSAPMGR